MALNKITDAQMNAYGVVSAPDILTGTPAQNKAVFDRLIRSVVAVYFNALVDAITSPSGANEIGAEVSGIDSTTVLGVLSTLKTLQDNLSSSQGATNTSLQNEINNRYTKAQTDSLVSSKADVTTVNTLVKSITFNSDNGVFTITTQGGSVTTIDTLLEKVPASFSLENNQLVLTLEDGTRQTADLSAFLSDYTFESTTTIEAVQNRKNLKFNIKDGSIGPEKLSDSVNGEYESFAIRAETAQEKAEAAQVAAEAEKVGAQTAASEANLSKIAAAESATAAAASETAAQKSESWAATDAIYAAQSAEAALEAQKAAEAAALSSKQAAGGDFATPADVDYAKTKAIEEAVAQAAVYTDTKAAEEASDALVLAKLDATGKVHTAKTEILEVVNTKADKSTLLTMTLRASAWFDGLNDLFIEDLPADSIVEVLPGLDITAEELEALQAANLQDGGQQYGQITLKAFGEVPTISIPIRVIVRGDA